MGSKASDLQHPAPGNGVVSTQEQAAIGSTGRALVRRRKAGLFPGGARNRISSPVILLLSFCYFAVPSRIASCSLVPLLPFALRAHHRRDRLSTVSDAVSSGAIRS